MRGFILAALSGVVVLSATPALADAWWSGDWYVKLGGSVFVAPLYQGDNDYLFSGKPMFSIGKGDETVRFTSRNDNASFSLYENDMVRLGAVGKILLPRDKDTSSDLKGLRRGTRWFRRSLSDRLDAYPRRGPPRHPQP